MRLPLIAGNWKMHKTVAEAVAYVKEFRSLVSGTHGIDIVLAVPFTALYAVADAARNSNVAIGAQDVYWQPQGAFTGEISAPMIRDAGAEYVVIGHSERRTLFGETDETVRRKVGAALEAGLVPIVCIGETLEQRDRDETFAVLDRQIARGLEGLSPPEVGGLVVAYEPVWAIGTGRNATPEQAAEAHTHLRNRLGELFGQEAAGAVRLLYGGSVKPENIASLVTRPDVDGALVGGASLDVGSFSEIVSRARAVRV